jgi:hypothetical protein
MSAPASDVRAAAVELARLSCARLMNGNPSSWQTRELPDELSELLARAVRGAEGTDTPAAFASALAALDANLIADREAVQAEIERLMGAERLRRREQLESMREQTADVDTTRVFRVAAAPALPDLARPADSVRPPDQEVLRRAGASTLPPPKPQTALSQPTNPRATLPTIAGPPPTPAPAVESTDSPISGVWREANLLMGVPGRRTRRKHSNSELAAVRPEPLPLPASSAPAPVEATKSSRRAWFAGLLVLALAAALGVAWLTRSSSGARPSTTQLAP